MLFTRVLQQLGLADEIKPKTKFPPAGQFAVDVVARGEAQIAISQPMEVFGKAGVELVGLLPPELQDPANFVFSASVLVGAKEPEPARALIRFLLGPTAASAFRARGMKGQTCGPIAIGGVTRTHSPTAATTCDRIRAAGRRGSRAGR